MSTPPHPLGRLMGAYDFGLGRPNGGWSTATIHQRPPRIGGTPGACGCGGNCGGGGSKAGCSCSTCTAGTAAAHAPRLPIRFQPMQNGWTTLRDRPVVLPTAWSPARRLTREVQTLGSAGRAGATLSAALEGLDARVLAPEIEGLGNRAAAGSATVAARGLGARAWSKQQGGQDVAPDEVYIYLSVGPRDDNTGISCTHGDTRTCSLWRIHSSFSQMKALAVLRVRAALPPGVGACAGWLGHADPAATTRGRVAYVERCHDINGGARWASIIAEDVGGKRVKAFDGTGAPGAADDVSAAYPAWLGESIVFNVSEQWTSTLWLTGVWPTFTGVGQYLGPTGMVAQDMSFSDPNVIEDGESGGARIVTFGGACESKGSVDGVCDANDATDTNGDGIFDAIDARNHGWERIPRTFPLFYESYAQAALPQDSGLDNAGAAIRFSECHHPAWRPDGQAFRCTRYQSPEVMSLHETGCEVRRLYTFSYADSYATATALIEVPSREEIRRIPKTIDGDVIADLGVGAADLFMPRTAEEFPNEGCGAYIWKFAEWCGSSDWAVATLFCTENSSLDPNVVRRSRVVLIDLRAWSETTGADRYVDLTSWVEDSLGVDPGSADGAFSSCSAVPGY